MRFMSLVLVLSAIAVPAWADGDKETRCRERADLVMDAFNARVDGDSKRKVRRGLRQALDRQAGDALAEFVFSVPEAQLTDDQIRSAGDMFFDQCKTL